jgi:hypothetical protein
MSCSSREEVAKRANRGGREGGASSTGFDGTGLGGENFCGTPGDFLVANLRKKPVIASYGEMEVRITGRKINEV